jgi:VWFA-related protein
MIRMAFRFLVLCVLCSQGFGVSVTVAQVPATASPSASPPSDANTAPGLRVLDLIALDKDGRPVTDLKPEELPLFEDKAEQKIKSLSAAANEPLTIGLFFDISLSRRADLSIGIEARLASELVHSIWHEGNTGFVVTFNDEVNALVQPTNRLPEIDLGLSKLPGTPRRGSTALYEALCLISPEKLARIPGRKVFVVFSDFEDNASQIEAEHVLKVGHRGRIAIFPVILVEGFGGGISNKSKKRAEEVAQDFADKTGGEAVIPESGEQVPMIFRRLTADLQSAYRITYLPASPISQDQRKRGKLKLQTTRAGLKLLYPKG